ncbi:SPOR domain-containing protein [Chondrinema litorale]|uniref:SPOR domain-containing protein n=1 Tax=Chondrinema litorale TaxID=2994555 RepID=UPI0025432A83|nr:SPOR domain-containing protein [Chondrinema litorale]UZR94829.1 SPOR domain-containing protein [Chondrinema litorale]
MISDFLAEALQEKNTVSVPGFGTFTSQPVSAHMDEETGILKPPSSEIVFIDDIGYGDAEDSLVEFIIYKTQRDREEVVDEVNEFGNKVKEEVNQNDSYTIDGFGVFEKGLYGNITFKNEGSTFGGNSYGLPKLTITPLSEDEIITDEAAPEEEEEETTKKFPEATLWAILIPSIIIVLLAVWLMIDEGARSKATNMLASAEAGIFGGDKTDDTANSDVTSDSTNNAVAEDSIADNSTETTAETTDEGTDNSTAEDQNKEEAPKEEVKPPVTNPLSSSSEAFVDAKNGHYYLSIASYPDKENAMKRRDKLVAQGYTEAKVVEAGAGKYRVSLADFASKADADKKVQDAKGDYDSIWVFKF